VLTDLQRLLTTEGENELVLPKAAEDLRQPAQLDLRVVATWDTDAVEIDLVVIEPGNGLASRERTQTLTGGQLVGATTGGFGPEQYLIKRALPGEYRLLAEMRPGRKRGSLPAPSTVYLDITKGFGSDQPEHQRLAVRVGRGETELAKVKFSVEDMVD